MQHIFNCGHGQDVHQLNGSGERVGVHSPDLHAGAQRPQQVSCSVLHNDALDFNRGKGYCLLSVASGSIGSAIFGKGLVVCIVSYLVEECMCACKVS